jgi:outer membrane immunogenic protein
MKKLFLAGAALIALIGAQAGAADLSRKPVYKAPPPVAAPVPFSWTGFYVGGNAGGSWGRANDEMALGGAWLTDGSGDNAFIQPAGNNHLRPSGFTGGLHAGYNFQFGPWVTGIEAAFNYFGLKDDSSVVVVNPANGHTYTIASSYKSDWLGTVRPRIGYTFDRLLVYAAGGLAFTNQRFAQSIIQSPVGVFFEQGSISKVSTGWTVGGGAEYALLNRWSVRAEYLYVDPGSVSFASVGFCPGKPCPGYIATHAAHLKANLLLAGITYHFN